MDADSTAKVMLVYHDRDKRQSRLMFRLPFSISGPAALDWAEGIASIIQSVSDAVLQKIIISWDWRETSPLEPGDRSDVNRKAVLFYRNDDYYEAIFVPSPINSIFESEGTFAGVRVDPLQPEVAPWTINAPTLLANIVTDEGLPHPTQYQVGGLMI